MYKNSQNQKLVKATNAKIGYDLNTGIMSLSGDWLWASINELTIKQVLKTVKAQRSIKIDATMIDTIDTTGMYFIKKLVEQINEIGASVKELKLPQNYEEMFSLIEKKLQQNDETEVERKKLASLIGVGAFVFMVMNGLFEFVTFFGNFCLAVLKFFKNPLQLKWSEVSRTINNCGAKGMWVVALLCFLIGVTLSYEMSPQFITYGANVYIVNFLGIALLKEVAPLLSAVIVAGRTGASITAEIGTQKLQEEIDAIKTMGISPMQRIVLPKVLGVMVAVPLITSIGDLTSMLGGALVSKPMLGISYSLFLERVQTYVATSNYASGIIKSFAFAMLIALAGCFCGFRVENNANSIGEKTTASVVLGIILVIFCDAVFAIIFNQIGW